MNRILTIPLILFSTTLFAQTTDTTYWTKGGTTSLTLSQVSLTNWAAGGENTVSINGNFSVFANRIKDRGKWENSLDIFYGLLKQGSRGFIKTDGKSDRSIRTGADLSYLAGENIGLTTTSP